MLVSFSLALRQPDSVNDGGVIEGITDDCIFWSKNSFKETSVGIEPTWEKNTILQLIVLGYNFFELLMYILSSTDKTNWAHAETMSI